MDLRAAEREPFVRREAGDDPALADEVLALCRAAEVPVSDALHRAAQIGSLGEPTPRAPDEPEVGVRSTATDELLRRLDKAPRLDTERYHLEGQVGRGGVGVVLRLHDRHLHRRLAMKVLREHEVFDSEDRQLSRQLLGRFLEEAQVTSQLDHPGVVPVHELGLDQDGKVYFTMRLVRGQTAGAVFASARAGQDGWTTTRALEVVLKVCDTIAFAHDRGVMHRDLKPANVMVGKFGEVYVMDWGLAKLFGAAAGAAAAAAATDAEEPLATARRRDADSDGDAAIATLPGQKLGTPEYMAPEQAAGTALDERVDVHAIGAMLFELLTGRPPYGAAPGEPRDVMEILRQVRDGSPMRIEQVQPGVPAELVAITERAMARNRDERYPRVADLAADLRAFLDQRAVQAYRTGALVELKLWVRRNKALAASLAAAALLLVAGSLGIAVYAGEAKRNERQAKAQEARADAKVREFDQLAGVVLYERAVANEELLWPPWPQQVEAMERWLADTDKLLAMRPEIEATVASQRERALPWSEAEQRHDRESHPRYAEWQMVVRKVEALRRAQANRQDPSRFVEPVLGPEMAAQSARLCKVYAESRSTPRGDGAPIRIWGEEDYGLAAARAAVRKVEQGDTTLSLCTAYEWLAWAAYANGLDDAAVAAADMAIEAVSEEGLHKDEHRSMRMALATAIASAATAQAEAEEELSALAAEVTERRKWSFAATDESLQFLHAALVNLLANLSSLEAKQKADVEQRLSWARQVEAATITKYSERWAEARRAILSADGVTASELYRNAQIDLPPQMGLVPIGMNPKTKLWEFYELRSAWDCTSDPTAILIPEHRADGSIAVTGATGIVFVLLPGGSFLMGAQKDDSNRPNYDRAARDDETVHSAMLAPFFLARHEMTRGQWHTLTGTQPFWWVENKHYEDDPIAIGPAHPADSIFWDDANGWMERYGMCLPTEEQWEYGCRAGKDTPWWPGPYAESLQGCANIHDHTSMQRHHYLGTPAPITDGFISIAPVGSFRANSFGLHDTHGNVWEWCRDPYAFYTFERAGYGSRSGLVRGSRVMRGGAFESVLDLTRSAIRGRSTAKTSNPGLGLRPARLILY